VPCGPEQQQQQQQQQQPPSTSPGDMPGKWHVLDSAIGKLAVACNTYQTTKLKSAALGGKLAQRENLYLLRAHLEKVGEGSAQGHGSGGGRRRGRHVVGVRARGTLEECKHRY
jgi:hypothetical protein